MKMKYSLVIETKSKKLMLFIFNKVYFYVAALNFPGSAGLIRNSSRAHKERMNKRSVLYQ